MDLSTAATTGHQLFLADLVRHVHLASRPRAITGSTVPEGSTRLVAAVPRWRQDTLVNALRDMSRVTVPDVDPIDPAFTRYVAAHTDARADARGWPPSLRERVQWSLYLLTAVHGPHERIKASTVATLTRHRSMLRVTETLEELGLLDDDRIDVLGAWIQRQLADVRPQIRDEALTWIDVLRNGGPRRRPRAQSTVRTQVHYAALFLLDCSQRYRTLRQVTPADLTEWLARCAAPHTACAALRSMFKILKAERLVFVNPARGLSLGSRPSSAPTPLRPEVVNAMAAAAETDVALKLLIALIGIHALYPHQARALPLTAIDLTRGRLTAHGIDRPLDPFTRQAAGDYLQHRHKRWPRTRNPYLFVSSQTANTDTPVTFGWTQLLLRGLPATAQQLREDRLLEEAAASGADPLHLCALFNITPVTGLRYARPFWPDPGPGHPQGAPFT